MLKEIPDLFACVLGDITNNQFLCKFKHLAAFTLMPTGIHGGFKSNYSVIWF